MSHTETSFSGQTVALCRCCTKHGNATLENEVVTCVECGQPCSCQGCVAESYLPSEEYRPGGDPE